MRIKITTHEGDWKYCLGVTTHREYDVLSDRLEDFLYEIKEMYNSYINSEDVEKDDLDEYLTRVETLFYEGYLLEDPWCQEEINQERKQETEYEEDTRFIQDDYDYYIDFEKASKEDYDQEFKLRAGHSGSSHWVTNSIVITDLDTGEVIFEDY